MSVPVWTWRDAVRKARISSLTKLVCYSIANYMSDVGEGSFPSVKTLMSDATMSNRSIATHIQHAVDAGLLVVERRTGDDGRFVRTLYLPRFPDDTELARTPAAMRGSHDEADVTDDAEAHVKQLHADKTDTAEVAAPREPDDMPREPASPGPREPDDMNRVKLLHAELSSRTIQSEERTPLPPTGEDAGRGKAGRTDRGLKVRGPDWERILANLRSNDAARNLALDLLVAPVIAVRRLDAPTASAALRAVLDLAVAKGLGETGLRMAATVLLGRRAVTVKPADFEAAILTAHGAGTAKPVRRQVRIAAGDASWSSWLAVIAASEGAEAAAAIEAAGWLAAETRWPVTAPAPSGAHQHPARGAAGAGQSATSEVRP